MKIKKHLFLDRRTLVFLLVELFIGFTCQVCFTEGEMGFGVFFAVLSLMPVGFILFFPCFYIMTDEGLRIFYLLGFSSEYIPWRTVTRVEIQYDDTTTDTIPYIFDVFRIRGKPTGKPCFYKKAEMIRTRRARKLIERYTGRRIEGYMLDDFKQWRKDRRRKAEKKKAHRARMKASRPATKKRK